MKGALAPNRRFACPVRQFLRGRGCSRSFASLESAAADTGKTSRKGRLALSGPPVKKLSVSLVRFIAFLFYRPVRLAFMTHCVWRGVGEWDSIRPLALAEAPRLAAPGVHGPPQTRLQTPLRWKAQKRLLRAATISRPGSEATVALAGLSVSLMRLIDPPFCECVFPARWVGEGVTSPPAASTCPACSASQATTDSPIPHPRHPLAFP